MEPRIIRLPAVVTLTGLSKATIYRLVKRGRFPKSVRLTERRAVGWRLEDIEEWAANRQSN